MVQQTYAVTYPDEQRTAETLLHHAAHATLRRYRQRPGGLDPGSRRRRRSPARMVAWRILLLRRPHHPTDALDRNAGRRAQRVGVGPPQGREWFDLLERKLLPQLQGPPLLIVAIVGGTNIGKSVIFNHLAGETASASTPLAAGTKHPVCLVPAGCDDPELLGRLFEHFELHAWQSADDPLDDSPTDRIYWRLGTQVPPRLVLVDAPDVDSDVTVNWQRARAIRQTADVLIALLTQQKYNDAAVKQFFRAAVEADKPIIVIFNFCDLEADRDYWPQWLARFCAETGADPELVYVVPYDRAAADELRLPFYRLGTRMRDGGRKADEAERAEGVKTGRPYPHPSSLIPHPSSPSSSSLPRPPISATNWPRCTSTRSRSAPFAGRWRGCSIRRRACRATCGEIRAAAGQFAAAASALSATEMARVAWPGLPTSVLVEEMQQWWDADRSAWSRRVHGFYRVVGRGIMRPVRAAWTAVAGPSEDPLAAFQRQEQAAVVMAVEKLLDELARLAQVGNEILQPRLQRILGGQARSELLARIEAAHRSLPPVDEDYRAMLRAELDAWKASYPRVMRWLQTIDQALAVARPAITVTLLRQRRGAGRRSRGPGGHARRGPRGRARRRRRGHRHGHHRGRGQHHRRGRPAGCRAALPPLANPLCAAAGPVAGRLRGKAIARRPAGRIAAGGRRAGIDRVPQGGSRHGGIENVGWAKSLTQRRKAAKN